MQGTAPHQQEWGNRSGGRTKPPSAGSVFSTAKVVRHSKYPKFQMAEVAGAGAWFAAISERIQRFGVPPNRCGNSDDCRDRAKNMTFRAGGGSGLGLAAGKRPPKRSVDRKWDGVDGQTRSLPSDCPPWVEFGRRHSSMAALGDGKGNIAGESPPCAGRSVGRPGGHAATRQADFR